MKISALPLKANPTGAETALVLDGGVAKRIAVGPLVAAAVAPAVAVAGGLRDETLALRDQTLVAASLSQASLSLSRLYQTVSSGLAATAPNEYFAVAGTGEVFATVYQKVSGAAVLVNVLASQIALDRVGRFIPSILDADNSIAINAALNLATVAGVFLPAGDIRVDHAVQVPSGKFVRGAGRDVTRLVRFNNIASCTYIDKGVIVAVQNAAGIRVSDLTAVSPKVNDKVQGFWMLGAKGFRVERCAAYNCGYAFWAHEHARDGIFDDIWSFNANVHFEATESTGIVFRNMIYGNGDGDNPLGYDAVYHALHGSKDITFMDGRGSGGGNLYSVVENGAGSPDNIRFIRANGKSLDGKVSVQISSVGSEPVGRVLFDACEFATDGLLAQIATGDVTIRGGSSSTNSQDAFQVYGAAKLRAIDHDTTMVAPPGSNGIVYQAVDPTSSIRVDGGSITSNLPSVVACQGMDVAISPTTKVMLGPPNTLHGVPGKGQIERYTYKVDMPLASSFAPVGYGTTEPALQFGIQAGVRTAIRFRGRMLKTGAGGYLYLMFDGSPGVDQIGSIRMQDASGAFASSTGYLYVPANENDIREFDIDVVVTGSPNTVTINYGPGGNGGGATILKGASLRLERLD